MENYIGFHSEAEKKEFAFFRLSSFRRHKKLHLSFVYLNAPVRQQKIIVPIIQANKLQYLQNL